MPRRFWSPTHCAGVVAASWNGLGVSGMTSGCRIMAVKTSTGEGSISDLAILKGMTFVADAADQGVDVRVTNNSYGGVISCPLISVEIAELEKRGIVCVYSSGNNSNHNDDSLVTPNQVMRASNTVIVNAATQTATKANFSNYGETATDVYAPGTSILSTVSTQGGLNANRNKLYFGSIDPSAVYYNTSFDTLPTIDTRTDDYVKFSGRQITDSYSFDADGRALQLTIEEMEYEASEASFFMDIPVGNREDVSYVSMAVYVPGGQNGVSILREGTSADGRYVKENSPSSHSEGGWSFVSISGVPDRIAQGNRFPLVSSEDGQQNYVRITMDISKYNGNFQVGDTIYIDQIGVGTDTDALLPYGFMDGTSMACPHVAAEAAILYGGKTRSRENAAEVVREIKSRVISGDTLGECRSHGAVDMSVTPDHYAPVVEDVRVNGNAKTITVRGCNFGSDGRVYLDDEAVEIANWNDEEVIFRCPDTMNSGVMRLRVETAEGSGSFGFLADAPSGIQDSAMPLYEHDIPDIPEELFPSGSIVCGAVGLNDYLYILLQDTPDYENYYANKMLRYSIREKTWEGVADLPKSLCDISAAGYRGKIIVSGTYMDSGREYSTIFSYSPTTGEWTDLNLNVTRASMLVNFKGELYSMGGVLNNEEKQLQESSEDIKILNISDGTLQNVGSLVIGVMNGYTATDGNAIYLAGGYKINNGTPRLNKRDVQQLTVHADGTVSADYLPLVYIKTHSEDDVICGYQGVYLVGPVGTTAEGEDAPVTDTYILQGESYSVYDKRFSQDLVSLVRPAEYKGELYAFGWSVYDGDSYLNFISRSTTVGEANAPVWDTFTIKTPVPMEGLVENGKEQTGVPESPEGYYTVTGNTAVRAGTYTATLKLTDPDWCIWEDGTTEDKEITWKIAEAAEPTVTGDPTVTVEPTVTGEPPVTTVPIVTEVPKETVVPTVTGEPSVTSVITITSAITPRPAGDSATVTPGATAKGLATAAPGAADGKSAHAAQTGDTARPVLWAESALGALIVLGVIFRKLSG